MLVRNGELAYRWGGGVYLNVTNRCPTACVFCAKLSWSWSFRGHDLRLGAEPPVGALVAAAERLLEREPAEELVFCGYGEPTLRLPAVLGAALRLADFVPAVRLNTVGLGSAAAGRDIVPELAEAIDAVSVSVNTADPAQWRALHRPAPRFERTGFDQVCDFVSRSVAEGLDTTVTAVQRRDVDLGAVSALACRLGARFRLRPELAA